MAVIEVAINARAECGMPAIGVRYRDSHGTAC